MAGWGNPGKKGRTFSAEILCLCRVNSLAAFNHEGQPPHTPFDAARERVPGRLHIAAPCQGPPCPGAGSRKCPGATHSLSPPTEADSDRRTIGGDSGTGGRPEKGTGHLLAPLCEVLTAVS